MTNAAKRDLAGPQFEHYAQDGSVLLRELATGALPALQLRALIASMGIKVVTVTPPGQARACPATKKIEVGGLVDLIAHRGPFSEQVREFTSILAWGFAHIRLCAAGLEADARTYAAAFLCPLELIALAPELPAIRRGAGVEGLARRFAVAPWVAEEALRQSGLVERLLLGLSGSPPRALASLSAEEKQGAK